MLVADEIRDRASVSSAEASSKHGVFPKPAMSVSASGLSTLTLHANIHLLASIYLATELQICALAKLHATLFALNLSKAEVKEAVLDLLEVVYTNDTAPCTQVKDGSFGVAADNESWKFEEVETNIRALVSMYTACNGPTFMKVPRFHEVLRQYGELGHDFIAQQYRNRNT